MIVIHVDTMEDTARLKKTYDGLENVTLLYNPTKEEVVAQLKRDDDPLVMCLGHGSSSGLFNRDWFGYVVEPKVSVFPTTPTRTSSTRSTSSVRLSTPT